MSRLDFSCKSQKDWVVIESKGWRGSVVQCLVRKREEHVWFPAPLEEPGVVDTGLPQEPACLNH